MKPNIVFAFADDWGRYASAYAEHECTGSLNELISTPNFDRVAKEGVLFTNALVPAPTCTPCRSSIRTRDFIYIINFEPDRWPMGDPRGLDDSNAPTPDYEALAYDTMVAYRDLDASPTKAWMIHHRGDREVKPLLELAVGKRPREELYDLNEDPHYMKNVADDPAYANVRRAMEVRLMKILVEQYDPRVTEQPCRFESAPYAGPLAEFQLPDWS